MPGTLLAAAGLNPLRAIRAACALDVSRMLLGVTPQTSYTREPITAALAELGFPHIDVAPVMVDPYRVDVALGALADAVARDDSVDGDRHTLVGSGTKPIVAATAATASRWSTPATTWTMSDRSGLLHSEDGQRMTSFAGSRSVSLSTMVRLHAGLEVNATDRDSGDIDPVSWTVGQLDGSSSAVGDPAEAGYIFERAVEEILRGVLPEDFAVYGSHEVTLRHPHHPERPAVMHYPNGREQERRFEFDACVIRATEVWVFECKFKKPRQQAERIAAAELDLRRRQVGGLLSVGVLVTQSSGRPEDQFNLEPAGIVRSSAQVWLEAGRAVLEQRPHEAAGLRQLLGVR